jgi:hypothetical protein
MSHTPTIVDHARVTIMTFYLPSIPASLQTLGRCECVAFDNGTKQTNTTQIQS